MPGMGLGFEIQSRVTLPTKDSSMLFKNDFGSFRTFICPQMVRTWTAALGAEKSQTKGSIVTLRLV